MALELEARVDDGADGGGVACTKHLVQPPSSEGFVRGAGRRGEQLEHHKKASEDRCPAELDTVKHSEVMGTGEKAVRERGGDHQRTSLAQERHKGSAWGRGSTPRSPCASKTGDLHGAEIKGVPGAPLYLELPDVQAEGGLAEIIACTHAQTGANTRIRTHDRGEHTRSNPRGDKGNDRVPALSTSIIAPKSFYRYSYRGQQSTHMGGRTND